MLGSRNTHRASLLVNHIAALYAAVFMLGGGAMYALSTGTGQAFVLWAVVVCCAIALVLGLMDVYDTYNAGKKNARDRKKQDVEMGRMSDS